MTKVQKKATVNMIVCNMMNSQGGQQAQANEPVCESSTESCVDATSGCTCSEPADLAQSILLAAEVVRLKVATATNKPCATLHKAISVLKELEVVQPKTQLCKSLNILNHANTALSHLDGPSVKSIVENVDASLVHPMQVPPSKLDGTSHGCECSLGEVSTLIATAEFDEVRCASPRVSWRMNTS